MALNIEQRLKKDITEDVDNPLIFEPPASNLNLSSDIQNLIDTSQGGIVTPTDITLPTVGSTPSLQFGVEAQLPQLGELNLLERPELNFEAVEPVKLGTELTPGEERARLETQQGVRTALSARGLGTSPVGAEIESRELRRFEEGREEARFLKERALTDEQLAINAQKFGADVIAAQLGISVDQFNAQLLEGRERIQLQRAQFASTQAIANFDSLLQSEQQRFGQEQGLFTSNMQLAAFQAGRGDELFNRQVISINLGLQERGMEFNEQLSTFSANLASILGSRQIALDFMKFVSDRDFKSAEQLMQKQQIDQATTLALIGAAGQAIGIAGGILAGKTF